MRFNRVRTAVTGAFVAVILLFGGWSAIANAQVRIVHRPRVVVVTRPFFFPHYYSYSRFYPRYYSVDPIAYERETGYRDGLSRGRDDAKHGMAYDPNSHRHYRDSNSITYREAFVQGYSEGYRERAG